MAGWNPAAVEELDAISQLLTSAATASHFTTFKHGKISNTVAARAGWNAETFLSGRIFTFWSAAVAFSMALRAVDIWWRLKRG